MKHTSSINERKHEAILHMKKGLIHLENVERKFEVMTNYMLTEEETINFLKLSYDRKLSQEDKWNKWDKIEPIYLAPKGFNPNDRTNTVWKVFNMVTEFEDHHSRVNSSKGTGTLAPEDIREARQVKSLFADNIVKRKLKAFSLANEVISGTLDLRTGNRMARTSELLAN